jgi:splicing suppressor protein 51
MNDNSCALCNRAAAQNVPLLRCAGCKDVSDTYHCGKPCQKADWKQHKPQCSQTPFLLSKPSLNPPFTGAGTTPATRGQKGAAGAAASSPLIERRKRDLLPPWWDADARKACEAYDAGKGGGPVCRSARRRGVVRKHHDDSLMPMQLRMFAEQIYGTGPGGQSGLAMLQLQAQLEQGIVRSMA